MSVCSSQVRAEERYFSPFLCKICKNLASLNAIVTTECSHLFCQECFENAVSEKGANPEICPSCNQDIGWKGESSEGAMVFADTELLVRPLSDAQPLAFQVLRRMLVECPRRVDCGCEWSGEYEALSGHLKSHSEAKVVSGVDSRRASLKRRGSLHASRRRLLQSQNSLRSVNETKEESFCETHATHFHSNTLVPSAGEVASVKEDPRWSLPLPERSTSIESLPIDSQHDVFQTSSLDLPTKEKKDLMTNHTEKAKSQVGLSALSLKSQANQKFKDCDYGTAQELYTRAIAIMNENNAPTTVQNELHSSLYCNRAVTFHKERKYTDCIVDCQAAIALNSQNSKAYLREWKSLIAIGSLDKACSVLEMASTVLTEKNGIVFEELRRTRELKRQLSLIEAYLANQEVTPATAAIESIMKMWDSPCVALTAARADIVRGAVQVALDRSSKVLEVAPSHTEALYLRAYATFLIGEMENAMEQLKESHQKNPDNPETVALGRQCRKTHKAFVEGQLLACEGEYENAVDRFTSALEGGLRIPTSSPLQGMILVERGEALLLCGHHREALLDAQQAIEAKEDYMRAWIVKIEAYHGMGRPQDALHELNKIRRTWASDHPIIADAYKKAEFEVRLQNAEMELREMIIIPSVSRASSELDPRDEPMPTKVQSDHGKPKRRSSGSRRRRSSVATGGLDRVSFHSLTTTRRTADAASRDRRRGSML